MQVLSSLQFQTSQKPSVKNQVLLMLMRDCLISEVLQYTMHIPFLSLTFQEVRTQSHYPILLQSMPLPEMQYLIHYNLSNTEQDKIILVAFIRDEAKLCGKWPVLRTDILG